ncbi:hypothetical protein ABTE60_20525, partial [Acinetobacter baumannii]
YLPFRVWQLLAGALLALPCADLLHRFISGKAAGWRNAVAFSAFALLLLMMAGDFESSEIPVMALAATMLTMLTICVAATCFDGRMAAPLV